MEKIILFDVDGTLVDTKNVVLSSFKSILKKYLSLNVSEDELTFALGITSEKALRKYVKDKDMLIEIEREWNRQEIDRANENNLFSGVRETIQELYKKNIRLGVVTSETKKNMKTKLRDLD